METDPMPGDPMPGEHNCCCLKPGVHFNVLTQVPLPLMPLYDLPTSAALIPMTVNALRTWLCNHKEMIPPPVYRRDHRARKYRLLSAHDLRVIRTYTLRGPGIQQYTQLYPDQKGPLHGGPAPRHT